MQNPGNAVRYTGTAIALHWIIAVLFIFMIGLGLYMSALPNSDPSKFPIFQLHKSIGITILALVIVRMLWRALHTPPALPTHMNAFERVAAHFTHYGLYAALIIMPFTGWAIVSTSKFNLPTYIFNLFTLPPLAFLGASEQKAAIHEASESIHSTVAWIAIALIALHVLGALKHQIIDRDNVLKRMLPGFKGNKE